MGNKLVIAEKPSVAEYIAKVIGAKERVKNEKGAYWKGNGYIVTNCIGHLITLAEPDAYDEGLKQWKFETLPFLPEKYKFRIIPQTRKQYDLVKNLMLNPEVDEIIVATDAGREGCAIYGYVAAMVHNTKPEKRLWISSMTEKSVKEGMENLKDNQCYKNMYKAALMRAEADFLVGINMSRYYTLRYGGFEHKFPCGRVQTATLSLIVEREKKIKNFISQKFFKVYINTANGVQAKYDIEDGRLTKLEDAIQIKNKIHMKKGKVTDYKVEVKNRQRPHLYNLNDLQREGNRKYGYSAKKVLDILQSLYEGYKIVTYPRTDSRYLNSDMVPDIIPLLQILCSQKKYLDVAQDLLSNKILIDNHIIDDNKVTDHHAIIFTEKLEDFDLEKLSEEEKNIINLIIVRFMEVLSQKMEYQEIKCEIEVEGEVFKATERKILKKGFLDVTKKYFKNEEELENKNGIGLETLKLGMILDKVEGDIKEGMTSSLPHYDEDSILKVMENPYLQLQGEDKEEIKGYSLGTSATRAEILESLLKSEYIIRNKKQLLPTEKGIFFIEKVDDKMKNPVMTAEWEQKLQQIEEEKYDPELFMKEIREYVKGMIVEKSIEENSPYKNKTKEKKESEMIVGNCPLCASLVKETRYGYCCENKLLDNSCKFNISKEDKLINKILGTKITRKMAEEIINSGEIVYVKEKKRRRCVVSEYMGNYIKWKLE